MRLYYLAWLLLACMCMLLVFNINLTSDLLFLDSLVSDIFQHAGLWEDWKLTPAPAYFPDVFSYAVSYFLFSGPVVRILFVCTVQAMLLAWICVWLASIIRPNISNESRAFIVLIVASVVLVAARSGMWLLFNSTNNHFSALFFSLFCTGWIFHYVSSERLISALAIVAGVAVGKASTSIFLLAFTLPALMFLVASCFLFYSNRELRWKIEKVMALVTCGHILALGIDRILISHDALSGRAPVTVDAALASANILVVATRTVFSFDNIYSFILSVFVLSCMVSVFSQLALNIRPLQRRVRGELKICASDMSCNNWRYNSCIIFLMFSISVNVLGAVLSGGFVDAYGYRYFAFPISFGVLLWVLMIDQKPLFHSRVIVLSLYVLFFSLIALGLTSIKPLFMASGRANFEDVLNNGMLTHSSGDAVGECLNDIAANGFPLRSGIANFWNGRSVIYKSAASVFILPVFNTGAPFFHMTTLGPLIDPDRYGVGPYNFAILGQSGKSTPFELLPETIGKLLPIPSKVVRCNNSDYEIWIYSSLSLDGFVKRQVARFLFGIARGEYVADASELPSQVGQVHGLARVANDEVDSQGFLSYGPYIEVPAGRYQVIVDYASTDQGNKWDIVGRFGGTKNEIPVASGALPIAAKGELNISFEAKRKISLIEIRSWFGGKGRLTLNRVTIRRE